MRYFIYESPFGDGPLPRGGPRNRPLRQDPPAPFIVSVPKMAAGPVRIPGPRRPS